MYYTILVKGLIIGFLAAAPIGPVNILCIQRTLSQGRLIGFVSGLGAATIDAVYGGIAGLGLTFISRALVHGLMWIRLLGGAFVCFIGIRTILAEPVAYTGTERVKGAPAAYASTLVLTLVNPTTIFSYGLLFAGLGMAHLRHGIPSASLLVAGVFLGSALWWALLSTGVNTLRSRFSMSGLKWINRISGAIVIGTGLSLVLSAR